MTMKIRTGETYGHVRNAANVLRCNVRVSVCEEEEKETKHKQAVIEKAMDYAKKLKLICVCAIMYVR